MRRVLTTRWRAVRPILFVASWAVTTLVACDPQTASPTTGAAAIAPMPSTWPAARVGPHAGGAPTSLVVLLHGYGDTGAHFSGVADALAPALPKTIFVAPDAWQAMEGQRRGPPTTGRQWFSIHLDDDAERAARIADALVALRPWINQQRTALGLDWDHVAVVGFSQGAMLANQLALVADPPLAGIVAIGGRLSAAPALKPAHTPSVLVLHGEDDQRVPSALGHAAVDGLRARGVDVRAGFFPGLGHSIDGRVLQTTAGFLRERLVETSPPAPAPAPAPTPATP